MNKPAIITSPSGDRLAVIPLEEYERLTEAAEDAADVRAYDAAKSRIAAGEDEAIPAAFANRILDGENKVRVWREFRGMTVKDLAAAAGITAAYLSQIETGTRDGSIATFKKIAAALKVSIDDIA
ncbi:helix-turn-helix transcriptional regulator [Rhodoplanes sp. SY1]|uniref:helix-turn-helix transcriptional regulator n=1 Tax=Rhodoplanes sp. SY1 TaxID=3166646 RepID=UPI0038B65D23